MQGPKREPERGLILCLGKNPLEMLTQKAHPDYVNRAVHGGEIPCYLDGLFFLARNGFRVEIPAAMAFKTGGALPNGKFKSDYFNSQLDSLAEARRAGSESFLRKVVRHHDADIAITLPEADRISGAAGFIRDLMSAVTDCPDGKFCDRILKVTRHEIPRITAVAAEDAINAIPKDFKKPVIVLTDNGSSVMDLRSMRRDLKIIAVNSAGFLHAMNRSGIYKRMGLNLPTHLGPMVEALGQARAKLGAFLPDKTLAFTDSSTGFGVSQDHSFQALLETLEAKLAADPSQNEKTVALTADQEKKVADLTAKHLKDRVERFRMRRPGATAGGEGSGKGPMGL